MSIRIREEATAATPLVDRNLRHLRLLLAVADTGSVSSAAGALNVSQPAVTQAVAKLEHLSGGALFDRTRQGFFPTARGEVLCARLRRVFARLDAALSEISPRLCITASSAQLNALVAVQETQNFTLAARRLGLAQPTVHRAITTLEKDAGRTLFERSSFGLVASRQARALSLAVRLAFHEIDQAEVELAELDGGAAGALVIGALPLSRSVLLPQVLVEYRKRRPTQLITVIDGQYDELLGGVRRGEIDMIVGALRSPAPIDDIEQERLFDDHLSILAGNHHALAGSRDVPLDVLRRFPWVVPRRGTPTRAQFDALFADSRPPERIIETGSILMMREILGASEHLGCISVAQARAELSKGLVSEVGTHARWTGRPIGLTYRTSWVPTGAQALLLDLLRGTARAGQRGPGPPART